MGAELALRRAIDGVDGDGARTRLAGDVALFRVLLGRLVADFDDLGHLEVATMHDLPALAARLHNLKGSSGMLGARSIHRLADDAESACLARELARVGRLVPELVEALAALRSASRRFLDEPRPLPAAAAPSLAGAPGSEQIVAFDRALERCDFGALQQFAALSPWLVQQLGTSAFAALRQHMDAMRFDQASSLLEANGLFMNSR